MTLKSARRNQLSAYQCSGVINGYLANEVRLGCVICPFDAPPVQNLHVSVFGVIPKKEKLGNGTLSLTYPCCKATASTTESIQNFDICSTSQQTTLLRWLLNLGRVLSLLHVNCTLNLCTGIFLFIS